jgi:alpha-mannosidase
MKRIASLGLIACVLALGCNDSKNPLSQEWDLKPDNRLVGLWRWQEEPGEVTYFHIGQDQSGKFFSKIMRVTAISHSSDSGGIGQPVECLALCSVLGGKKP